MSDIDVGYSIKRRSNRQKVDFRIRMTFVRDGTQESVHGRGSDLSEGGVAVYAATDVSEGTHVRIDFTLPYSRRILYLEAIVRNKQGYRYGLEFLTLSSAQRDEIKRLCNTARVMDLV